jgi:hypothetical protein
MTSLRSSSSKRMMTLDHEQNKAADLDIWRANMTAVVKALSRSFPDAKVHIEILKTIATYCGVGLTVSLLAMSHGLDLSPGFF